MSIDILAAASLALAAQLPSLPAPVIAPQLRSTDCAVPEERARLLGRGEAALQAIEPLLEASQRMQARMAGNAERLLALGVWGEADRTRFSRQLLANPAFVGHGSKVMAVVVSTMESIEVLGTLPQDEERSCRAVLDILEHVDKSAGLAEEGWILIDRAFADEARRLGVSLD